ncbi:MAG: hypothetical protein ACPGLY_27240 [Rubripirellula sp.]
MDPSSQNASIAAREDVSLLWRHEIHSIRRHIQNIGFQMGENGRTPEWYRANHRTPWVASHETTSDAFSLAKQNNNRDSVESSRTQ